MQHGDSGGRIQSIALILVLEKDTCISSMWKATTLKLKIRDCVDV